MNQRELIARIATETGTGEGPVKDVLDAVLVEIAQVLEDGEQVVLPGFGTFEVRDRAARMGRNPQTGAEIDIAASKAPAFKPAAALKRRVNTG